MVNFPSPTLVVDCGDVETTEPCPEPVDFAVDGCADSLEYDAGETELESLGRIVQLSVTLRNVCPNRRVALAVILTEVGEQDMEYSRDMKTLLIPAHNGDSCRDVAVRCVKFVLPESLDDSGSAGSICGTRNFRARFIANYIVFECCQSAL